MVVSWSDEDDSKGEVENEYAKHVTALTGKCMSDTKSCDEELTYEELAASYKELYTRSTEVCKLLEKQKKTISQLHAERSDHLAKIYDLNDEVTQLNSQLEHVRKQVRMMNTCIDLLKEMLEGQNQGKPNVIGFDYKALNKQKQNQDRNFVYVVGDYRALNKQQQNQDKRFVTAVGRNI